MLRSGCARLALKTSIRLHEGSGLQGVYIPSMLHELTTQRVLTMEWVDGVRLRSAGDDPSVGRALSSQDLKLVEVRPWPLLCHPFCGQGLLV